MTTTAGSLAAAILLTAAATSHAQTPRAPLSVADIEARGAQIFADADTDGDGLITEAEFASVERRENRRGPGAKGPGRRRQHLSSEASAEHRLHMEDQLFDQLDADDDEMLSREEFSIANQRAARETIGRAWAFARLDENDDGVLSPDEFPPRRLAQLDTNGDGELSREELNQRRHFSNHNGR
jgi:Ca2+-binding EF-hand superfamily protein